MENVFSRLLGGSVPVHELVFAREVRHLDAYEGQTKRVPLSAAIALRRKRVDPRSRPLHAERIPFVITDAGNSNARARWRAQRPCGACGRGERKEGRGEREGGR